MYAIVRAANVGQALILRAGVGRELRGLRVVAVESVGLPLSPIDKSVSRQLAPRSAVGTVTKEAGASFRAPLSQKEISMNSNALRFTQLASALGIVSLAAACSTWDSMTHQQQGTAVGAASGAAGGAAVAGPPGAVVGGVAGGVVGHEAAKPEGHSAMSSSSATVRSAQQALTDRGYDATPIDGQFGAKTEDAVRRFQNANGIPPTGRLDSTTLSALNITAP
jgi:murein L,D-transpeptidase YcbB/YkuD